MDLAEPVRVRENNRTRLRKSPTTHQLGNNDQATLSVIARELPGHAAGEPSAEYAATGTSLIRGGGATVSVTFSGEVDTSSVA